MSAALNPSDDGIKVEQPPPGERGPRPRNRGPKKPKAYETRTPEKVEMGRRIRHAREMAEMTMEAAARELGYAQPVQLSLIESGHRAPGVEILGRIARLYGTTTDFLYGLTQDSDRDPAAAMVLFLGERMWSEQQKITRQLSRIAISAVREIFPSTADQARLASLVVESKQAFDRMRAMTPEFDEEVRGASVCLNKLENAVALATAMLGQINRGRRQLRVRMESHTSASTQGALMLDPWDVLAAGGGDPGN